MWDIVDGIGDVNLGPGTWAAMTKKEQCEFICIPSTARIQPVASRFLVKSG